MKYLTMRGWIPSLPIAGGMLAFGLSWVVLFEIARRGSFAPSFTLFGWIHLITLGWVTLIAISILLHALPAFLDVEWRWSGIARGCTLLFALGVAILLTGFFTPSLLALQIGASIACAALCLYALAAIQPLRAALRGERSTRAVSRAFSGTILLLILTALIGTLLTYALGGHLSARLLEGTPAAHAFFGIGGWLTLLVLGISARTMRPIAGARSRWLVLHILAGTCVLLGSVVAAIGALTSTPTTLIIGALLLLVGTLAFAIDIGDVLRRATVTQRPPQVLMGCAALWAVIAALLVLGSALGEPWPLGAIYAALIGWIGSAVLAHLHHIGVRVLLTNVLGEADETRPAAVLTPTLTWTTLILYELAALLGCIALLTATPSLLAVAALSGLLAFLTMLLNLARAFTKARNTPPTNHPLLLDHLAKGR